MSVIVLDGGEAAFLANGVTGVAYTLRLFKTDVTAGLTPTQVDALTAGAFVEATFAGYAGQTVATGGWSITQGNPTRAVNVEKQFTRSSTGTAQNIFGYYVTRNSDGAAMWFEEFPGPVVVEFINDRIDVTPAITLDDTEGNGLEVGDIIPTARATAAPGRLLCNGAAVSRTTYANLFAAIGTAYGTGDGSTTFNLPDLRQRFPLGKAAAGTGATLGGTGGTIDHVHGLDTASSYARISHDDGNNQISSEMKAVANWTRNRGVALSEDINTGAATDDLGARLIGNSDTANPPFQVVNYEIVH